MHSKDTFYTTSINNTSQIQFTFSFSFFKYLKPIHYQIFFHQMIKDLFSEFGSNIVSPQTWTSIWNPRLRSGLTLYFPPSFEVLPILLFLRKHQNYSVACFVRVNKLFLLAQRRMQPSFCIFFVFLLPETEHTHMWESICWQIFISSC